MRVPAEKRAAAVKPRKAETWEADRGLYDVLKELRLRLAQEEKVAPFVVFSNATLEDMTRKAPQTIEEFLAVSGVGNVKAEKYGDAFIRAIRTYMENNRTAQDSPA